MPALIAYIIALSYDFIQEFYIRRKSARSFHHNGKLDKTTVLYVSWIFLILIAAPFLNMMSILQTPELVAYVGLVVMIIGITLRALSMLQLGERYTRALSVNANQDLKTNGVYKYIRHPGYSGTIIAGIGFALSQGNLLVLFLMCTLLLIGYTIRIRSEEKVLMEGFGKKYKDYMKKTKRLIPFVF